MPKNPEREGSAELLTIDQIARKHGVSRSTVHTYRRGGTFPRPVPVEGTTRVLFDPDEVKAWFAANPKKQGSRTDLAMKKPQQGDPVITTVDARRDLYAFAMQGKEHSPANSERASEKIDAYRAAVLREAAATLDKVHDYPSGDAKATGAYLAGMENAANKLRRMADETEA